MDAPIPETGEEVAEQTDLKVRERTQSETREAGDELATLSVVRDGASSSYSSNKTARPMSSRQSGMWDDSYFEGSDDDDDVDERHFVARMINPNMAPKKPEQSYQRPVSSQSNGAHNTPAMAYTDGHRGLSPTTSKFPESPRSGKMAKANVDDPIIANRLVEEPEPLGSTAGVGLRKSVDEQVLRSPTKAKGGSK
jgi:hypothetical protein